MTFEREVHEAWRKYLQTTGCRPMPLSGLFEAGYLAAKGIESTDEYQCQHCGRPSFPDYGRCAFCGVIKGLR